MKKFVINHPKNKSNKIFLLGCTRIGRWAVGGLGILRQLMILFLWCNASVRKKDTFSMTMLTIWYLNSGLAKNVKITK